MKTFTDLEGVFGGGIHCGIKPLKKDLAFIFVPKACASAGVFTQNKFAAASIFYTKACLKKGTLKALLVNSGNANAGTGKEGQKNVKHITRMAARYLKLKPSQIANASTGIIARPLPMEKIQKGVEDLLKNPYEKNGKAVAQAIMTTDSLPKDIFLERKIDNQDFVIAGITKGSGMIAPNMATTLTFLVTNIQITHTQLQRALKPAVEDTFNMISVDSDTSTNDMVLIWATGEKKVSLKNKKNVRVFQAALKEACLILAKQIVEDGEGASKMMEVCIKGAVSKEEARRVALNVVNSPLVKTAVHGADPNWGRVLAAACKEASLHIDPEKVDLFFGPILIFTKGEIVPYDLDPLIMYLKGNSIQITLNLHLGKSMATAWGCDLTKAYVAINTKYS